MIIISLFLALVLNALLLNYRNSPDLENASVWGIWAKDYGLPGYYDYLNFFNYNRPNQPPLAILLYLLIRIIYQQTYTLLTWVNTNSVFSPSRLMSWYDKYGYETFLSLSLAIANLGLGVLVYRLARYRKLFAMNLVMFNPLILLNYLLLGLTGSISLFFIAVASLCLFKRNYAFAGFLMAVSLLFNVIALIYIPMFAFILITSKPDLEELIKIVFMFFATIAVVSKPFTTLGSLQWAYTLYFQKIIPSIFRL